MSLTVVFTTFMNKLILIFLLEICHTYRKIASLVQQTYFPEPLESELLTLSLTTSKYFCVYFLKNKDIPQHYHNVNIKLDN